ncbi:formylglycine-generating enzyme family protein [Deinococcus yavapaiensis]|uniref:Formylglycine-generating enzyme required for sulfatase activity n=1 Tax=Deinococcus yavapaiensis KR-236 TaxID=694435 RepID=A0A318S752_9DEIO|nr:formylglycine-generating enzyme family protein [Deinococcus yavapaiensis]PYE54584.1 formylglycine-generating enzyme required for sulfatase activity [Deinococcus yavapaiensis KR-236]
MMRVVEGRTWIEGGSFLMGSDRHYPEEKPRRRVTVGSFWIDTAPVTNAKFSRFVRETLYVTAAERAPDPRDYPGIDPALLRPGSAVFVGTSGPVPLDASERWWTFVDEANWRAPEGPGSTLKGREDHPVVHITAEDAFAYAAWAGGRLPSEAQWEYAARGGLEGATYTWGDEAYPGGRVMANTWQGRFPWENLALGGFDRTSPVGSFPANGFGLVDMAGNVWEWTRDEAPSSPVSSSCCAPPARRTRRLVVKGGSHLCAPEYCFRFRPAARQFMEADSASSHVGLRLVYEA